MDLKKSNPHTVHGQCSSRWQSDSDFFWFCYKLIQANLPKYFKNKQVEAQAFVRCVAKLHSESMCAELIITSGSGKKGKAPPAPIEPQISTQSNNNCGIPDSLTSWPVESDFYMFVYRILRRNKSHFGAQQKSLESFLGTVTKLYSKSLMKEFCAQSVTNKNGLPPEKCKEIELTDRCEQLEREIRSLRAQLQQIRQQQQPQQPAMFENKK